MLEEAAENIRKFHSAQVRNSFIINDKNGVVMGQKIIPLDRGRAIRSGGTAAYPSTVLMDSIPAKIAGCPELFMVTPPSKDGSVRRKFSRPQKLREWIKSIKSAGRRPSPLLPTAPKAVKRSTKSSARGNAFVAEAKKAGFRQGGD